MQPSKLILLVNALFDALESKVVGRTYLTMVLELARTETNKIVADLTGKLGDTAAVQHVIDAVFALLEKAFAGYPFLPYALAALNRVADTLVPEIEAYLSKPAAVTVAVVTDVAA